MMLSTLEVQARNDDDEQQQKHLGVFVDITQLSITSERSFTV